MSGPTDAIALVTGANKGIGFEVARGIAKAGYVVLLGARNPTTGREAADSVRNERLDVRFVELDLTRRETISAAAGRIEAEFGKLDVLINNAGIADPNDEPPSRASVDAIERVLRTNFLGAVAMTQAVLPLLKKIRNSPGRERFERAWVDHRARRSSLEVCVGEGTGILRVEGGAEHVHRAVGFRIERARHRGEFGQSRLHGHGPECTPGASDRRGRGRGDRARGPPREWTERKVLGSRR